jgi:hypothetical protein
MQYWLTQQKVLKLPEQTGLCQFVTDQRHTEMQTDIKRMVTKWNINHWRQEGRKSSCTSELELLQPTVKNILLLFEQPDCKTRFCHYFQKGMIIGVLGYDVIYLCRQIATFRRNLLPPPSSATKLEAAGSPEKLVRIHRSTWYHILEDRNDKFLYFDAK